jgi:hypothetical protein
MSEGETNEPIAQPPPLGDQTAEASLVAPSADDLQQRSDLALFVGPNVEKFVSFFGSAGRRRISRWACWPGFFFPVAWFMYRKMYGWAALACALPILAGVMNFGPFRPALAGLPTLVGVLGRRVYLAGARRTIARVRASLSGRPEEELRETLAHAGGVSIPGAIIGGAIVLGVFAIALHPFANGFVAGFQAHDHR